MPDEREITIARGMATMNALFRALGYDPDEFAVSVEIGDAGEAQE